MWKWIKALNPFAVQLRNTKARLEFARVLLAQAEIELADKAFYVREFAAVSAERDALKAEIKTIIEATEQDGCDTALDAVKQLRDYTDTIEWREAYSDDAFEALNAELAALRERASVPVPAGVPSVEELGALARNVWKKLSINEGRWLKWEDAPELDKQRFTAIGSAIRDAVLAGVAQQSSNAGQFPPDDQVEALARVLEDATAEGFEEEHRTYMRRLARAAIAHLAKRPEGLPTVDGIAKLIWDYDGPHGCEYDPRTCEHTRKAAEIVYTALRPWLSEPVGCELDVRAIDIANIIHTASVGAVSETWKDTAAQRVLDLCRSRIRPVYECKECAGRAEAMMRAQPEIRCATCAEWEKDCRALCLASRSIDARIAARAALEANS